MSNSLVFSIALEGYSETFKPCLLSQKAYCQRNGYDYVCIENTTAALRPIEAAWLKIPLIIDALESGREWVMFIDADCEIRPHAPRFECVHVPEKSVFLAKGHSGRINSGVIIVRNTDEAVQFFASVLLDAENPVAETDRTSFENGHIISHARQKPFVELIDNELWNNNIAFQPHAYIQHFSGGALRALYLNGCTPSPLSIGKKLKRRMVDIMKPNSKYLHRPDTRGLQSGLEKIVREVRIRYPKIVSNDEAR